MRIIPVLDILGGRAVHARAGNRDSYAPLSSYLAPGRVGDPLALARAFHDQLGFEELYLADLDAIMGRPPQRSLRRAIAGASRGVSCWLDAGVASPAQAREVFDDGAARVIIGLETLPIFPDPRAAIEQLVAGIEGTAPSGSPAAATPRRAVFSLDLRAGQPLTAQPALAARSPLAIAELAAESGIGTIIVLDLARVGTGAGVDLALIRAVRRALPEIELVAGGGVRDSADLERLSDSGADGALVGSALHDESAAQGSGFWTRGPFLSESSPLDG
jgi:phosphoribosylformimino-5-aminoimidazole carboxamide ribotide isomerase